MTKKIRHWRGRSKTTSSVIKTIHKDNFASAICPTNLEEQKEKFLSLGKTPEFIHRGTEDELEEIYQKPRSEIRFDLLGEAIFILKTVKSKYGDAENYYREMYGERVSKDEATDIIVDYLKENHLDGAMTVIWCTDLPCSGRMMWQGPHVKYKRPEDRKYSMWIKDSKDNHFLRERGMRCLADHEIGTHFFRSFNDGLQPWFADRTRFGIRGLSGLEQLRTEEGLAAINTVLNAKVKYLWGPALLYYIACKASEMTFKQLFEHLKIYVENPEWRWRHCVRVKRGLLNPNDIGGYGKDQCYFEGAVEILRNIDTIDFKVLMSGKVCFDEIQRVKKLARMECIRMPAFMRNQEKYKKSIKQICQLNGLHMSHDQYKAPLAYLRRLKQGRRIGVATGNKKVRKRAKKGSNKGVGKSMNGIKGVSLDEGCTSDEDGSELCDDDRFFMQRFDLNGIQALRESNFLGEFKSQLSLESFCSEKNRSYSCSIVNNLDKVPVKNLEHFQKVEERPTASPQESNSNQDLETDSPKPVYRSVSRASIQSRLSLRSYSLASRGNRNSNADNMSVASFSNDFVRPDSACSRVSMAAFSAVNHTETVDSEDTSLKVNLQPLSTNSSTNTTSLAPLYTPAVSSSVNFQNEDWCWDSKNISAPVTFYPKSAPLAPIRPVARTMSGSSFYEQGPEKFIYPDNSEITESTEDVLDSARRASLLLHQQRSIGSWIQDIENIYNEPNRESGSREATPQGKLLKSRASSTANLLSKAE